MSTSIYNDFEGERLTVSEESTDQGRFTCFETHADVWLSDQQVKDLIHDLARRIGNEVVLFGPEAAAKLKALALDSTYPRD